jgi:uncharacterized protein YqkB
MKAKSCAVPAAGIVSKAAKPHLIDEKGTPNAISPIYIMHREEIFYLNNNKNNYNENTKKIISNHSNIDIHAFIILHR